MNNRVRITGGSLRGRTVTIPAVAGVRPTSGRVREAIFSMLGQDLTGWRVLDAFGGSGLMAFEALSRGAESVTINERSRRVAAGIQKNCRLLGVQPAVVIGDAQRILARGEYELVFLDPPYAADPTPWLDAASGISQLWIVLEHQSTRSMSSELDHHALVRQRRYGDTSVSMYRRRDVRR